MSAAARLGAFAALLVVVFAAAALAGGALGGERRSAGDEEHAMDAGAAAEPGGSHAAEEAAGHGAEGDGGHGGSAEASAPAVKGLAVSDQGYTLELDDRLPEAGRPAEVRFRVVGADGAPVTRFAVEHERRMHLIIVRRDGTGFQHLHPRMSADGTWRTRTRFDEPGTYRIFADFKKGERAITLGADAMVDGVADYRDLPAPATVADTGTGYEVRLAGSRLRAGEDAELRFTVTRDGETVHTEPYLGAGGHLVALREGDLAYLHTHPADHPSDEAAGAHDDAVPFETGFPSAGRYRLYFQFKADGDVHTAEFTQEVSR